MTTTPGPGVYTRIPIVLPYSINPALQGLYSSNNKLSYQKISHSLGATRLSVTIMTSLWNSTGAMTEMLPRCLSNYIAIRQLLTHISRLRDFGSTSYLLEGPMILTPHFKSYFIFLWVAHFCPSFCHNCEICCLWLSCFMTKVLCFLQEYWNPFLFDLSNITSNSGA